MRYHSAPIPVIVNGDHDVTKAHPDARQWTEAIRATSCPFLWVTYRPHRSVGRWGCVVVSRPFVVIRFPAMGKGNRLASLSHYTVARSLTLDDAVAKARKLAHRYGCN